MDVYKGAKKSIQLVPTMDVYKGAKKSMPLLPPLDLFECRSQWNAMHPHRGSYSTLGRECMKGVPEEQWRWRWGKCWKSMGNGGEGSAERAWEMKARPVPNELGHQAGTD
jgi:hypothetical protein